MKMIETWVLYAFVACIGYFIVNLMFRFVSSENAFMISLILYGVAAVSMFLILAPKMEFTVTMHSFTIAALIGVCSGMSTVFAIKSINLAPNPGYSVAIYSANFVLLSIVSIFVFNSPLTATKFLGVLATLIGLILLSTG